MRKIIFIVLLVFGFSNLFADEMCNDYDWLMHRSQYTTASSTWSICYNKIGFEITSQNDSFYLTYGNFSFVQGGNQFGVTLYSDSSEYKAKIHFDNFGGSDYVRYGVTVTGWIDSFPTWFNVFEPFRMYYGDDYKDVGGAPFVTTTSSSISSTTSSAIETTTTAAPTTTTTGTCASESIYGEHSEEVEMLRYVRDNVLSNTPEGRELIGLYYEWSPIIVKAIENDPQLKEEIKEIVDNLIGLINVP